MPIEYTKLPSTLTIEQVQDAAEADNFEGFCLECGAAGEDTYEPDARNCHCSACGADAVFGAAEILIMVLP